MSRFFRTTRTILGQCYKPTICMVSAMSLYSFPTLTTVSAATTMINQKPTIIDTIQPDDKLTKSTNSMYALPDPAESPQALEIISHVKKIIESDTPDKDKVLRISCAVLPVVIEKHKTGFEPANELMKQVHLWMLDLDNDPHLEFIIGKENFLKLRVLRLDHKNLVWEAHKTMILVLERCRDQKTNMEHLLSLIQKYESKSAFSKSEAQEYNDCLYDLSEWAKQKPLNLFWDKCYSFQTDVVKLKKEIDQIRDRETKNKIYTGLKYVGATAVTGAGFWCIEGMLEGYGVPQEFSKYITAFIKALGPDLIVATYRSDDTVSLETLLQMRGISNELSEIIQHCKILEANEPEIYANSEYVESFGEKLGNFETIWKIKDGLSRVIESLGKFETESQKMVQNINEIRKHM